MDGFWTTWLPNIICMLGGCLVSYLLGRRAERVAADYASGANRSLEDLTKQQNLIIERLEAIGMAKVNREEGKIVGATLTLGETPDIVLGIANKVLSADNTLTITSTKKS